MAFSEAGTVTLKLLAQDLASGKVGAFAGKLDTLAKRGGLVGSMAQGVGIQMGMMLNPMALVSRGIGAVTDYLGGAIEAFREEEVSVAKLTSALEANIPEWDGNTDAIERTLRAREALAFADDDQRDSLARLVAITHDETAALDLQRQAMDLARFRNMSLTDASALLGKVYSGNTTILKRYGIAIRAGMTSTEALAEIQKQAKGQAKAYAQTSKGGAEAMDIAFGELSETIGEHLNPAMAAFTTMVTGLITGGPQASGKLADLAANFERSGQAAGDAGSQWLASGTIFDSMIDGLNSVLSPDAQAQYFQALSMLDDMFVDAAGGSEALRREALDLGISFDNTTGEVIDFLRRGKEAGYTLQQLVDLMNTVPPAVAPAGGAIAGLGGVVADTSRKMQRAFFSATQAAIEFPQSIHDAIESGKGGVLEAMADLRWSIEHPFATKEYEHFLEKQQRIALRLMLQEQKKGHRAAVAEAWATAFGIQNALNSASGVYRLMFTGSSSGPGPQGAPPPPPGGHHGGGNHFGGSSVSVGAATRGGTTINVNFHSLTPPSAAEGQRLADVLVPALTRGMRRQRVL